jgi:hypothetical protein
MVKGRELFSNPYLKIELMLVVKRQMLILPTIPPPPFYAAKLHPTS